MNYQGPFRPGPIMPVVKAGENVLLVQNQLFNLYQVSFIEQIGQSSPLIFNPGAVAAGATLQAQNPQNVVDMAFGQMAQYRIYLWDDLNVVVLQPAATARQSTKNQIAQVNAFQQLNDECGHKTEFFIFEDQRFVLNVTNPGGYNLAQSRIQFYGFKYVLYGGVAAATGGHVLPIRTFRSIQEATDSGQKFTVIPIGGWGQ